MAFNVRWGIMATGGIARTFVLDFLQDAVTRGCPDINHQLAAVASESGKARAQQFVKDLGVASVDVDAVHTYGNYADLVADPTVDIVYVATPHGRHYKDCLLALNAGKNVLCEKAFTINKKQLEHLVKLARTKNLFLMEAVWTRYFPLVLELQRLLFEERVLGDLRRVIVDLADVADPKQFGVDHRLFDPIKGGGALLDIGIYSLTWVFVTCFADPNNQKTAPSVSGRILKHAVTGVDVDCSIALAFEKSNVMATALTSVQCDEHGQFFCLIQGDKGDIFVNGKAYKPDSFTVKLKDQSVQPYTKEFSVPGRGMSMEADEAARLVRDGKLESPLMTLEESVVIMGVMDEVRYSNGFRYPEEIEEVYE